MLAIVAYDYSSQRHSSSYDNACADRRRVGSSMSLQQLKPRHSGVAGAVPGTGHCGASSSSLSRQGSCEELGSLDGSEPSSTVSASDGSHPRATWGNGGARPVLPPPTPALTIAGGAGGGPVKQPETPPVIGSRMTWARRVARAAGVSSEAASSSKPAASAGVHAPSSSGAAPTATSAALVHAQSAGQADDVASRPQQPFSGSHRHAVTPQPPQEPPTSRRLPCALCAAAQTRADAAQVAAAAEHARILALVQQVHPLLHTVTRSLLLLRIRDIACGSGFRNVFAPQHDGRIQLIAEVLG